MVVIRFSIVALPLIAVMTSAHTETGPQGPFPGRDSARIAFAEQIDDARHRQAPRGHFGNYNANAGIISCHGDLGLTVDPASALAGHAIHQSVLTHKPDVDHAYKWHLSKLPKGVPFFDGRLSIVVEIGEDGAVLHASIVSSETGNDAFDRKILQSVESWRFPPSSGNSRTHLTWKFHAATQWIPGGAAS